MQFKLIVLRASAILAVAASAACSGTGLSPRQSAATQAVALINANPATPAHAGPTGPAATALPLVPTPATPARSSVPLKKYAWLMVEKLKTFKGWTNPIALAFSPDGKTVGACAAEYGGPITFATWNLDSGRLHLFDNQAQSSGLRIVAVSPDSKLLAIGTSVGDILLWDLVTGLQLPTLLGHEGAIQQIVFSSTGNLLAVATRDNKVVIWDLVKETIRSLVTVKSVVTVAFSPDFQQMVIEAGDSTLTLWDVTTMTQVLNFDTPGITGFYSDLKFSPDGKLLAAGIGDQGYAVQLWEVATGKIRQRQGSLSDAATDTAFSPDGNVLAVASHDGSVHIWDVSKREQLQVLDSHSGWNSLVAFSPDGAKLAIATADGDIQVWGVKDQSP